MRTRDELFQEAQRQVEARRQRAIMQSQAARETVYNMHPGLADAEESVRQAGLAMVLAATQQHTDQRLAAGEKLADAQRALGRAYRKAGIDDENVGFTPHFTCPDCDDTGVQNGAPCHCVRDLALQLRREEINRSSPLELCGFETFLLDCYPTVYDAEIGTSQREYMGKVLQFCQQYAKGFTLQSQSLLFTGTAGLGKTHMALAIADTVLQQGHDVLYTSAAALTDQLGKEHFDSEGGQNWFAACSEAELLVLDDLGTEYVNALTISVLYELINTRMLSRRPTIYTSNITDPAVFEARYTEKVASRILGSCKEIRFFGKDRRREEK